MLQLQHVRAAYRIGHRAKELRSVLHARSFCSGEEAPRPAGPVKLFEAKPPEKQSDDAQKAIRHSSLLMAGGVGSAFMGIAPFTSPNLYMIGLLLAIVQVHFGYAFMQKIYWTQRRRYVLEIEREEDDSGVVKVAVKCDAKLTRRFRLTQEAASGQKPSLADIIAKGGIFMFVDKASSSIDQSEMLDELLKSDRGITEEQVKAESVMGETEEQSLRIVQKFADLTREHLDKIPEKDNTTSPQEGLQQLESSAQRVGAGFMVGGLLIWVLCDWSAQAAIKAASDNYKPQATLAPGGASPPTRPNSRAAQ